MNIPTNLKVIDSENTPTTTNLTKGQMAFGAVGGGTQIYINPGSSVMTTIPIVDLGTSTDFISLAADGAVKYSVTQATPTPPITTSYFLIQTSIPQVGQTAQFRFGMSGNNHNNTNLAALQFRYNYAGNWTSWGSYGLDLSLTTEQLTGDSYNGKPVYTQLITVPITELQDNTGSAPYIAGGGISLWNSPYNIINDWITIDVVNSCYITNRIYSLNSYNGKVGALISNFATSPDLNHLTMVYEIYMSNLLDTGTLFVRIKYTKH